MEVDNLRVFVKSEQILSETSKILTANIETNFKEHGVIVESVWQIKEGGSTHRQYPGRKNTFIARVKIKKTKQSILDKVMQNWIGLEFQEWDY